MTYPQRPAFDFRQAKDVFEKHYPSDFTRLSLAQGAANMIDFYLSARSLNAAGIGEDGDMLLFQWGTYGFGRAPSFQINLTRQIIVWDNDEQEIWQLGLTYHYPPEDRFAALRSGELWCHTPEDAEDFQISVLESEAVKVTLADAPDDIELTWEQQ